MKVKTKLPVSLIEDEKELIVISPGGKIDRLKYGTDIELFALKEAPQGQLFRETGTFRKTNITKIQY
jgi:hypothetical protein